MTRDGAGRARAKRGIARLVTAIGIGSTVLLGLILFLGVRDLIFLFSFWVSCSFVAHISMELWEAIDEGTGID